MKNYDSFEEYMYDKYYDEIYKRINAFLLEKKHSSFLTTSAINKIDRFNLDDFQIVGSTFHINGNDSLNFRLSLTADVSVWGKSCYDYESDSKFVWLSVNFTGILKNGLHEVKITKIEEYSKERFNKEKKLDHFLVPYLYSEDADSVAEEFLKEYYPAALNAPMPLPVNEIVHNLGLKMYYAPLDNTTFGKIYFDSAVVTVYSDPESRVQKEISLSSGTILVNPDIYFMGNIGSINNTIIHECVHWKRHKMFFELRKLLNQDLSCISCKTVESYGNEKSNSTPLDWIEWQANALAPKILMPAATTKKYIQDRMYMLRRIMPASTRDAEIMAQTIQDAANFFQVSRLAAKLRAFELGFDQAYGTYLYIEGHFIPNFSFGSKIIGKNNSFVTDSVSALRMIILNSTLYNLYSEDKIIFVNNMLCINTPKYIQFNEDEQPEMTSYALDHIDECCFLFHYKKQINHDYDDSYYRACFLCREVTADSLIEVENKLMTARIN